MEQFILDFPSYYSRTEQHIPVENLLSPAGAGRSISRQALNIGDIILTTTDAKLSRMIRIVSNALVSHAILYTGGGMVIEAVDTEDEKWGSVVQRSLEEALKSVALAVVFRDPLMNLEASLEIRDFARTQIGKKFDHWGLVTQPLYRDFASRKLPAPVDLGSGNNKWFCSELVVAAYAYAGLSLFDAKPEWVSPGQILELRGCCLQYVGHLKS